MLFILKWNRTNILPIIFICSHFKNRNFVSDSFQEPEPERTIETPPLDEVLLTPNLRGLSPSTRRRLQAVKRGEMLSDPIGTPMNPCEF